MGYYIDIKYANLLSSQLKRFKWRGNDVGNFRCPLCGDSAKDKSLCRGYIYPHTSRSRLSFKCHNCGENHSFSFFLKMIDNSLYEQYNLEKFKNEGLNSWKRYDDKEDVVDENKEIIATGDFVTIQYNELGLIPIKTLDDNHPAKVYLKDRQIPQEYIDELFYIDNYKKWVNDNVSKNKFNDTSMPDERIVIPFKTKDGGVYAFQGRYIGTSEKPIRYLTAFYNENETTLIYGLDTVDFKKLVKIVEGPFDSMFVDNALAVAGSALSKLSSYTWFDKVYIYDNQPRNRELCNIIDKTIKEGHSVVVWPREVDESLKDINDMVKNGLDIEQIICDNTFSGLYAELEFNNWKKI